MSKKESKISVVIPAKNEAEGLSQILDSVRPYVQEILIIDGNSQDNTREIVQLKGARLLSDNGKGKGKAIRLGIKGVSGDIIVFMDADGSHEPRDIPKLVQPIINGRADMVIGSRIIGGSDEFYMKWDSFIRQTGNNLVSLIINYRWGVKLTDIQNGFRAIKTDVVRRLNLKADDFDIEEEMVMKCLKKGYRITEVKSHEYARGWGKSKLATSKGWKFILRLFIELFSR